MNNENQIPPVTPEAPAPVETPAVAPAPVEAAPVAQAPIETPTPVAPATDNGEIIAPKKAGIPPIVIVAVVAVILCAVYYLFLK